MVAVVVAVVVGVGVGVAVVVAVAVAVAVVVAVVVAVAVVVNKASGGRLNFEEQLETTVRRVVREELEAALPRLLTPAAPELLTLKQAAEVAKVSPSLIRSWISRGLLRRYGDGRTIRVRRDELLAVRPRVEPVDIQKRALEIIRSGRQ